MTLAGHARQTPDKGIHVAVAWTFADATARTNFVPTSGIPATAAELTADDLGKFAWQLDTDVVYILTGIGPETWVSIGALPIHAFTHQDGGVDEINVTGLSGVLADPQTPAAHAATHQNGGADEINVGGLSGLLADAQTPLAHAASHSDGGSDEVQVQNLGSGSNNTFDRLRPDGAGAVEWTREDDLSDFSGGTDTTSGTTWLTKASITLPAEDETFIVNALAFISFSNTTGNPGARLFNVTDGVQLGRIWNSEMADAENILPAVFEREVVQTVAGGAKVIALQYALASGTGTESISDAYIRARRKVA